jgi:hypothetical protein
MTTEARGDCALNVKQNGTRKFIMILQRAPH